MHTPHHTVPLLSWILGNVVQVLSQTSIMTCFFVSRSSAPLPHSLWSLTWWDSTITHFFFLSQKQYNCYLFLSSYIRHCYSGGQESRQWLIQKGPCGCILLYEPWMMCSSSYDLLRGAFLKFLSGLWIFPEHLLSYILFHSQLHTFIWEIQPLKATEQLECSSLVSTCFAQWHFDSSCWGKWVFTFPVQTFPVNNIPILPLTFRLKHCPHFTLKQNSVNIIVLHTDLHSRWCLYLESISGRGWLQSAVCLLYCSSGW